MKRRTKGGTALELAELLDIRPGVTAVIGGGGKTTLLRTLGEELSRTHTVLLCTTTKIFPFPDLPCARTAAELDQLRRSHRLLCAGTDLPGTGKLTAPALPMADLAERFDYVLVEADGAARRPLKAHAPHEPVIPPEANQTICVVGASGFGQPILEAAPETEAAVLRAEGLHDKIYVNQVEMLWDLADARALAALLDCPVLAGSLHRKEYFPCW